MKGIELHDVLDIVYWPAVDRVHELMERVKLLDLTPPELLALVAVLESANQRVNASIAPVLQLVPTRG